MNLDEKIARIYCRSCVVRTSYCDSGMRKKGFMCMQLQDFLKDNKQAMRDEIEKILRQLEELTPQGSEFYNNPEGCFAYIKERIQFGLQAKKDLVRLKRDNRIIPKSDDPEKHVEYDFKQGKFKGLRWKDK